MQVLSNNKHNEYPQHIFGFGDVFSYDNKEETKIKEQERLSITLHSEDVTFTNIKQVLDLIINSLGLTYEIVEEKHPSFIEGRCGRVIVKGKKLAYIGEIHPQVLKNFGLENPVAALEINVTELHEL